MRRSQIDSLLSTIRALPPFPSGVSRLMGLSQADPAYFEKASSIIKADPALAGQVVRIANSALYAGQARVDGLERAIMRVGIRMVVASLTTSWMTRAFEPGRPALAAVWLDNLQSALMARGIAERASWPELGAEAAYTFGLLHDVGRLVLMALYRRGMEEFLDEPRCPVTELSEAEHATFGTSHALAGRLLANRWNFPEDMTLVVGAHHFPPDQRRSMSVEVNRAIDLVLLSDLLAHRFRETEPGNPDLEADTLEVLDADPGLSIVQRLELAPDTVVGAVASALDRMEQHRSLLGIRAGASA